MIPRLFDSSATEFTTNGLGLLNGASSCSVRQALNGEYELQFTYPIKGARFSQLVERALVVAKPDPISNDQAFRIYRIVKSMKDTVTVYAEHLSYDLSGIPVKPFTASDVGTAFIKLKENMVVDSPFTFVTDKTTTAKMSPLVPYSTRSILGGVEGSILDTYRGEYEWDNFTVRLWNKRGADRGVHIRYGKNLTNFEQDSKCSDMYTAVYPYWTQEGDTVIGSLITVIENAGYNKILSLDLSETFQQKPTVEKLNQAAQSYISSHDLDKPVVSWKISFASLENTTEYAGKNLLEGIYLGDTVHVDFEKLGISVNSRAVETEYDPVLERYNSVTLGSVKANISDTIISQEKSIKEAPTKSLVESISSSIASRLIGVDGGCIRHIDTNGDGEPDELYIADDPDPQKAQKVWRFNYMGWAVSKTGYDGPFIMGATIEEGFLADFITAANLTAGIIQSQDKKSFYLNLNTGVMYMYNTKMETLAKGNTYTTADYSQDDIERIRQIYFGNIIPTFEDYEKLDLNFNGELDAGDAVIISTALRGEREINFTSKWSLKIDPEDGENLIKVSRIREDHTTNTTKEVIAFSTGFSTVKVNSLMVNGSSMTDFVVDQGKYVDQQGIASIWTYRKWNSGLLEYWGKEQNFTLEDGWHKSPAAPFTIINPETAIATVTNWYGDGNNENRAARSNIITCGGLYEDGSVSVYDRNPDGTVGTGYRAYYYYVTAKWK